MSFNLTADQQAALDAFCQFLLKPKEKFMVIQGMAGSGKTTLIEHMIHALNTRKKMYELLFNKQCTKADFSVAVTATTNKAVAVLNSICKEDVRTIQSYLNLRVAPNFRTGAVELKTAKNYGLIYNALILIDEASFINDQLFRYIDQTCIDCKVVLIGDYYQLAPVKQQRSIMESLNCTKVVLNEVKRHGGSILSTSSQYRGTVQTGIFEDIIPTDDIMHLAGPDFQSAVNQAFLDSNYNENSARILAWTNQKVVQYNQYIRKLRGYPEQFQKGEIVFTNNPIIGRSIIWPVDSTVEITRLGKETTTYDIPGRILEIEDRVSMFCPYDPMQVRALLKKLAADKNWVEHYRIKETWLDLRPAYASTVHKAQGSTYDQVFIDLTDIGRCTINSDIARMLYVAISRAKAKVYLYGQLPARLKAVKQVA